MVLIHFAQLCPKVFSFLVDRFGFEPPELKYWGGEVVVEYRKGSYLVRIVMISGAAPHVELVYPASETGEDAVPYLNLDGIPRAQRLVAPHRDESPPWPAQQEQHLEHLAAHLLSTEGERLSRWRDVQAMDGS